MQHVSHQRLVGPAMRAYCCLTIIIAMALPTYEARAQGTISSTWMPIQGFPVIFQVTCSPLLSSNGIQEYDVYFKNNGDQPVSFQVQMVLKGQAPQPYGWQTVPAIAPGQQYGGALQGQFWQFNLPCNGSSFASLDLLSQPNSLSGANNPSSSTVAANPESPTINCAPMPGAPCPSPMPTRFVTPQSTSMPGIGVRGQQTLPGTQEIASVASAISNLIYPTEYAPQVAPQYRATPPDFRDASFSCKGGLVDKFIVSELRNVADDYNTYEKRVQIDVDNYNRMISGPGGNIAENVTSLQNQLNTNVAGDESDYNSSVTETKEEIANHCVALAQRSASNKGHTKASKISPATAKVLLQLQRELPQGFKLTLASTQNGVQDYQWIRDVPTGEETLEVSIRPTFAMDVRAVVSAVASTGRIVQGDAYTNETTCNSTVHMISVYFHGNNEQYFGGDHEFNIGQRHYSIYSTQPMDEAAAQDVAIYLEHFCGI